MTERELGAGAYDAVLSRDALLHVTDKASLLRRLLRALRPGGRLLLTDYCRGEAEPSAEFAAYIAARGYHLLTVAEYARTLRDVGFEEARLASPRGCAHAGSPAHARASPRIRASSGACTMHACPRGGRVRAPQRAGLLPCAALSACACVSAC
jgi:SAM-dependent methyltransferase